MIPMGKLSVRLTSGLLLTLLCLMVAVSTRAASGALEQSRKIANKATTPTDSWPLPPTGPKALPGKKVVYIGEDLRNGGILGVGRGINEAAAAIGWKVNFLDIGTNDTKRPAIFKTAFDMKPDGIILGGMDGMANLKFLTPFKKAGIPIVGWHTAPFPGPVKGTPIAVNITTDSLKVARAAAHYVIADSKGTASAVIFTDSRFEIALKKSNAMADILRSCRQCTVLEIQDIALDKAGRRMPEVTAMLLDTYGKKWEYSLGINDLYFDHAIAPLVIRGCMPNGKPFNISAGDGSPSAFLRIQKASYQKATVPEPLLFHGWQLIDELNRLFHNAPPSGYITPPHIVTRENIWPGSASVKMFDPRNGYRNNYLSSWGKDAAE